MKYARLFVLGLLSAAANISSASEPGSTLMQGANLAVTAIDMDALMEEGSGRSQVMTLRKPERMRDLTEQLYATRVLARDARQSGLADDPLVRAQLMRLEERFLMNLLVKRLDAEPVPDFSAVAKEYYDAHQDEFLEGEAVTASHILIMIKDRSGPVRSPEEARKLAAEVHAKAIGGADFEQLAVQYSEDPSVKRNRGNLGRFGRNKMVKPFENTAFAMREPGQISDLVESSFGFHIIKLHEYEPGQQQPFDKVKESIVGRMEKEYRTNRREEFMGSALANGDPKIDDVALEQYIQDRLAKFPGASAEIPPPLQ